MIGRTDPAKGEIPVAFIQLKAEYVGKVTEEEMTGWCRENMAIYKVPAINFIQQLPLTATGKINKKELN